MLRLGKPNHINIVDNETKKYTGVTEVNKEELMLILSHRTGYSAVVFLPSGYTEISQLEDVRKKHYISLVKFFKDRDIIHVVLPEEQGLIPENYLN